MHDASTGSLIADRVCRHHDACVHRRPFLHVAGVSALAALHYTERTYRVALTPQLRDELVAAFTTLDLRPDAVAVLHQLRARGLRLAPLANFAPAMISALLAHHELTGLFDDPISSDAARTYKPDPRAYELAERAFDLPRTQIAFAAFGSWDVVGCL